jgi:hypothetical protein
MKDRNFYSGIIHKSPFGYAHHEIIPGEIGQPILIANAKKHHTFEIIKIHPLKRKT